MPILQQVKPGTANTLSYVTLIFLNLRVAARGEGEGRMVGGGGGTPFRIIKQLFLRLFRKEGWLGIYFSSV